MIYDLLTLITGLGLYYLFFCMGLFLLFVMGVGIFGLVLKIWGVAIGASEEDR